MGEKFPRREPGILVCSLEKGAFLPGVSTSRVILCFFVFFLLTNINLYPYNFLIGKKLFQKLKFWNSPNNPAKPGVRTDSESGHCDDNYMERGVAR
jgi:hypothetical protein